MHNALPIIAYLNVIAVHMPIWPHRSYAAAWQTDAATIMVHAWYRAHHLCSCQDRLQTVERFTVCCESGQDAEWFKATLHCWCTLEGHKQPLFLPHRDETIMVTPGGSVALDGQLPASSSPAAGSESGLPPASQSPAAGEQQGGLPPADRPKRAIREPSKTDKIEIDKLMEAQKPLNWKH